MSAYRTPAPKHTCRFDIVRYPPPHHDVPVLRCTCGAYPPDPGQVLLDRLAAVVAELLKAYRR